jgi:hypothetical protein
MILCATAALAFALPNIFLVSVRKLIPTYLSWIMTVSVVSPSLNTRFAGAGQKNPIHCLDHVDNNEV